MKLTGKEVYEKLLNEEKILEQHGQIRFFLGDVDIVVHQKDVVGNIIQEWLSEFFNKRKIEYQLNENTQTPPDFFLDPSDLTKNLLEVKAFNQNLTPAFDIADFIMYIEEIIEKPYMLNVDYLIFAYDMNQDGIVTIKNCWLKKVWEITRRMRDWPINLQIKEHQVRTIRPGIWYDSPKKRYLPFRSLEDFVSALEEAVYQNPKTHQNAGKWKSNFIRSYQRFYGVKLNIPRWSEIEDKYLNK